MADLLSGQLQVYIGAMTSSLEQVKAGRLRAGFETSDWAGVSAPKSTPSPIIEKLNKEINAVFTDPKFKARLAGLGGTPFPGSPAEFDNFIADDTEKWAKVIKFAGLRPD